MVKMKETKLSSADIQLMIRVLYDAMHASRGVTGHVAGDSTAQMETLMRTLVEMNYEAHLAARR